MKCICVTIWYTLYNVTNRSKKVQILKKFTRVKVKSTIQHRCVVINNSTNNTIRLTLTVHIQCVIFFTNTVESAMMKKCCNSTVLVIFSFFLILLYRPRVVRMSISLIKICQRWIWRTQFGFITLWPREPATTARDLTSLNWRRLTGGSSSCRPREHHISTPAFTFVRQAT